MFSPSCWPARLACAHSGSAGYNWVRTGLKMPETIPENRFEYMSPRRRLALIGSAWFAAFLILFALAEGAIRIRAWLKHGESIVRIEDSYRYDKQIGLRLPTPGFTSSRMTINSLGFRGPEISKKKPAGTYRIAFLGGSTTFCAEVSGDDRTWPYLVVESLKVAFPGRRFDYINAAVPGYTTRQTRKRFEAEVSALNADLVVIYHASNDLTINSRKFAQEQGLDVDSGDRSLSWLSKWSMLIYLVEKNLRVLTLQADAGKPSSKLDVDPSTLTARFDKNLRELLQSVRASGAKIALASFSTQMRRDQTPAEKQAAAVTSLYYMPYMTPDLLLDAFDAYNSTIRNVAKDEEVIFIDAASAIGSDSAHFIDSIHFTDAGAAAMAKVISDGLASAIQ